MTTDETPEGRARDRAHALLGERFVSSNGAIWFCGLDGDGYKAMQDHLTAAILTYERDIAAARARADGFAEELNRAAQDITAVRSDLAACLADRAAMSTRAERFEVERDAAVGRAEKAERGLYAERERAAGPGPAKPVDDGRVHEQCVAARVACFVKQLGAAPFISGRFGVAFANAPRRLEPPK